MAAQFALACTLCPPSCTRTNASCPPCQHHLFSLPQYPPCPHKPLLATPRAKPSHSGSVCARVHPMPSLSCSHQCEPPTMPTSSSLPSSIPSWLTRAPVSHPQGQTEPRRLSLFL